MQVNVFQSIQKGLAEKRQNLTAWLLSAPVEEKQQILTTGSEQAVQAHLHVIDDSLTKTQNQTLGLCIVCHEYVDTELLVMDYTSCVCLEHLTREQRSQLESDLELSQSVQRSLLPQQAPTIPGLELAAFSRPAQILGGDYFDFFHFPDGTHGLAIADAMGHGVAAGLLMTRLQTALRTLASDSSSPAEMLRRTNRVFLHNIDFTAFVTAFLAQFDPRQGTISYANAGHNPPFFYRPRTGESTWLMPTGAAIGLVEEFQISTGRLKLEPGDLLVLYTDGVTEAFSPQNEQFGRQRLAEAVQSSAAQAPQEMVRQVRSALNDFTGGQSLEDDTTLLALRYAPAQ